MKCNHCKKDIVDDSVYCSYCGKKVVVEQKRKGRGNGTGSVFKLKNGTWKAIARFYPQGKPSYSRSKSGFKTKKEALAYLPTLYEEKPTGPKKAKFSTMYESFIEQHQASKSTIDCYKAAYKQLSAMQDMFIDEITIDDILDCFEECENGKRTKQNMKAIIGLVYKYSIPRGYVPSQMNMADYITVKEESAEHKDGIPLDMLDKIKKNIGKVMYADVVYCHCYLGFRPSEFLNLKISDYDSVNKCFVGGAKTQAGRNRVVTVPKKIQGYVDKFVAGKQQNQYVFMNSSDIKTYRKRFYEVLEECGIQKYEHIYTPHSCRHTYATLLKSVEGNDKDKMELIGHASPEMLRYYQDVSIQDLKKITDRM